MCRDQSRPNRRAQARRSATKRDRIDAPSTPQHDRITTDCDQSRPIARKHALARLSTTNHDQSRPNRRAKHALARLSTTDRDQSRPNRRANRDRIDAPITTESTRQSRSNREIATESTRQSRPIDAIESRNRDRIDRIGRPPPSFLVWRAEFDPRSLNFFALHCAFLQKSCKNEDGVG